MLDVKVICARQVSAARKLESKFRVVQSGEDVRDDSLLVDVHTEDLPLLVDTNDTVGSFVFRSHEYCLARDAVHVDAGSGFEVV